MGAEGRALLLGDSRAREGPEEQTAIRVIMDKETESSGDTEEGLTDFLHRLQMTERPTSWSLPFAYGCPRGGGGHGLLSCTVTD